MIRLLYIPFNITKYILSIQDQLSKFIILACFKNQTAESVSDAFIQKFISIFGTPKVVLTDRETNFTSKLRVPFTPKLNFYLLIYSLPKILHQDNK